MQGGNWANIAPAVTGNLCTSHKQSVLKPRHGADRRAVAALPFQWEAAEGEQIAAAQVQVFQVLNVQDILFPEQPLVPRQVLIGDGIQPDHVEADALVFSGQDVVQQLGIHPVLNSRKSACAGLSP